MASIESINGRLYLKYYDPHKRYSRRKSLKLADNQFNRRSAQKIAKAYKTDFIPEGFTDAKQKYVLLSDAVKEFIQIKPFAQSTKDIYNRAAEHFINATSDKFASEYSTRDYIKLLSYFRQKKLSQNSQSIYTRTLHSLWKYFIKERLAQENIIEVIRYKDSVIQSIDAATVQKILDGLKKNVDHYAFVFLLVNTGMRVSTLLDLHWEDIDWKRKIIVLRNIKVKGQPFTIPLIPKFTKIFKQLGIKETGKVFNYKDRFSTRFYNRIQEDLKLKKRYGIHKLKHTFISEAIRQGTPLEILSELTNTSIRTLKKHYANISRQHLAKELQRIKIA